MHQVCLATGRLLKQAVQGASSEKYDKWLGTVGINGNNSCWKFKRNLEENHFAAGFWFLCRDTHRGHQKNLSQAARWTFPWTDRKVVDDQRFDRIWKFWVNQTQILLNVPVFISRKHIRHYIISTRIMKRRVTLKLRDIFSLHVLQ